MVEVEVLAPAVGAQGALGLWDWAVVVLVAGLLVASVLLPLIGRRHDPDAHREDAAYRERLAELRRSHDRQQAA